MSRRRWQARRVVIAPGGKEKRPPVLPTTVGATIDYLDQRVINYRDRSHDITSTYFEGQCAANPLAKRGYSRDHRPDCLQVLIGLVVTEEGFPLGYKVFAGNRHDSTTLDEMVTSMEQK